MLCEGGVVPTSLPAGAPIKPCKCSQGRGNQWQQELRVTYKIPTEASVCEARNQSKPARGAREAGPRYLRRRAQRRAQQRADHGTNQIRILLLVGAQRLHLRRAAEQRYFPVLLS